MRPTGLSAFVRCKNEAEYIVASLMSAYRVFDEIVVVLNNSTDGTGAIVSDLAAHFPKIRVLEYAEQCSPIGVGYHERVLAMPSASLARYYNWCLDQTRFSHVCKWDGDMVATPLFEQVVPLLDSADVIMFDGYDVLGEKTTDLEPRIFRFDTARARYVDWDLYEVMQHDYSNIVVLKDKCFLHLKLVKQEWVRKAWANPNLLATRSVPETGAPRVSARGRARALLSAVARTLRTKHTTGDGT